MIALQIVWISVLLQAVCGRVWNDTGTGSIIFEEAWTTPALLYQSTYESYNSPSFMVISCASPCIQGIPDQASAEAMARSVNDQLAASIANNTARFGGFAALAMHNATTAAQELKRAVVELGFLGALLNDYQESGPDNGISHVLTISISETLLFYDQPEYDVFWEMVTELDVPVYLHPRSNIPQIQKLLYGHAPWLKGPTQEFAVTLSTHVMGLCTNGVFDRFPNLNVIVGHLGERIPSDFWRIDDQLAREVPEGMPMLRNLSSYWGTNLFETVSGNFATQLFDFHKDEIGLDRILYSVDYPYVKMSQGEAWLIELSETMSSQDLLALKRGLAVDVLHLNR
ncbi:amidohydrolase 2 [Mycena maculata]|uniref:Amidohydrolase 2 n=1 Tax=Mycena maculata TaxID=230809 RepID=A0AAD7JVE5_9AGAR|nr:amidohydrolase 2 [Mycena maculata]